MEIIVYPNLLPDEIFNFIFQLFLYIKECNNFIMNESQIKKYLFNENLKKKKIFITNSVLLFFALCIKYNKS